MAEEIIVTSDTLGAQKPDSFDAPDAGRAPVTPVKTCMETCCKTFVERGSDQVTADGVKRL